MVRYIAYGFLYIVLGLMIRLGILRWRVEGREHLPPRTVGGILVVANHINQLDTLAIGKLLPFEHRLAWLGKAELFEHPVSGWFMRTMHVIPIQRGKGDTNALAAAETTLNRGEVLLVFPEGTRSHTGLLKRGRSGAVRLALATDVPIVPMAIRGTEHGIGGSLRGREVVLRIGKPYRLKLEAPKATPEQIHAATDDLMLRIAAMLPAEMHGYYAGRVLAAAVPPPALSD